MALRLLSLDFDPVYGESATRATFTGDVSVFDYDVVIWDPERTFSEVTQYSERYKGLFPDEGVAGVGVAVPG